jgi:hypothetical protein
MTNQFPAEIDESRGIVRTPYCGSVCFCNGGIRWISGFEGLGFDIPYNIADSAMQVARSLKEVIEAGWSSQGKAKQQPSYEIQILELRAENHTLRNQMTKLTEGLSRLEAKISRATAFSKIFLDSRAT